MDRKIDKRIGNQFWLQRSKHGREKIFETPEIMLEAAYEYFQWCDNNPILESVAMKRKISRDEEIIELIEQPKMRAYTMQGLCIFLHVNTIYFNRFEQNIKVNKDPNEIDFCKVLTHIREIIYNQKFTGAAAGLLNPNIIARDLGLTDKKEVEVSDKRESVDKLFPSEEELDEAQD